MTLPAVGDAAYPTPDELRDGMLRTIVLLFQRRGLTANVLPGSDHFIRCDAVAKRLSIALANNKIALADFSPLTATGDALTALLKMFGVPERPAAGAAGYLSVVTTASAFVTIPAGYQCTGPTGFKYQTTGITFSVTTGSLVQVRAVETGLATDLAAGQKVTWDSAAIGYLAQVATVAVGGLDGGADEDDEETKRRRLLERLSQPSAGGNVAEVKNWAEDSTAAIKVAFVYAAVRGPASYDIAVIGSSGDGILSSTVTNTVAAFVQGKHPGHASLNVTSVADQLVDIVLSASLPLPELAGGAGGGWRDASPWPAETTKVTAYNSGTGVATVNSTATPTAGGQIGIWDPTYTNTDGTTGKMREYVIAAAPAVGGGVGAWTFAVSGGFGFTPTGAYVSAGAVNLVQYANATAAQVRALGPGEKTSSADILPRGRRQPGIDVESPSGLTSRLLDAVETAYPEIEDIGYALRVKTGTGTAITTPDVPATTTDPPNRLALKFMAFRKA